MKKLLMTGAAIALAACAGAQYDKDKFHLTSDAYYISEIKASDRIRESDGFMTLSVSGAADADTTVYYRVIWFDENGAPIKTSASKSTEAKLRSQQPFHWNSVSPNANAKTYKVYVSGRAIEQ
jgi:uncharacterized protein YcfL